MPRLPDRFDYWVGKARECGDPIRQVDYVLGALAGLNEWHFLNIGTKEKPNAARTTLDGDPFLLVYSDTGRIEDFVLEQGGDRNASLPLISIATTAAMAWAVECRLGLLLNPPDQGVLIPGEQLREYHAAWTERGGPMKSGFWIPNLTSEEEDFWQEHGY